MFSTKGYDPIRSHQAIEKLVTRADGRERKYWRFRVDRWYGGIVTADAVGCGLFCRFCWVSDAVRYRPREVGRFYTAKEAADRLLSLSEKSGIRQLRVSGGEPAIGKRHLLELLEELRKREVRFILETSGIPIGYDETYAKQLSRYEHVHVRVSLKGCNEREFHVLTGCKPEGFGLQLKALENLVKSDASCHPAVMRSFSTRKSFDELVKRLEAIDPLLPEELEVEELILYPRVVNRLRKYGLRYYVGHLPDRIPPEQI
jgi:uncharacterized Fe-S cluster-containing radical SAM superfamily protein